MQESQQLVEKQMYQGESRGKLQKEFANEDGGSIDTDEWTEKNEGFIQFLLPYNLVGISLVA